jgi:hypothetical protein
MKKLRISLKAEEGLYRLAKEGVLAARSEVARVYAYLERLERKMAADEPAFWNIPGSASGALTSRAKLKDGTPIWRLYPTHVHCIALLAIQDGDLFVLAVCREAEVKTIELELSSDC